MKSAVGPYRIIQTLGRGGMGVVYRGVHSHLDRVVAIKQLAPELTQHPQFRDRFFSEARTQAQLQHPNIVTIYDLIEEDGEYFIAMEYVEGRGLDQILSDYPSGMPIDEATAIFGQVLSALDYAHSQGVIHRDVKPSNVLVTSSGEVKLMDFGIALLVGDKRLTQSSQTIGTPVYMSVEQILRPREVDHRSDIYSSAVLFFEMLAGRPPYDAETEYEIKKQHIEALPPDLAGLLPAIPAHLGQAVSKALAKDPKERFSSAAAFLRSLDEGGESDPGTPLVGSRPRTTVEPITSSMAGTLPGGSAPGTGSPSPAYPAAADRPAGKRNKSLLIGGAVAAVALIAAGVGLSLGGSPGSSAKARPVPGVEVPDNDAVASAAPPGASGETTAPVAVRRGDPLSEPVEQIERRSPEPPAAEPSEPEPQAPRQPDPRQEQERRRRAEEEIQRRMLRRVRGRVIEGITEVEQLVAAGELESAQRRVQELKDVSAEHRADLVDEVVRLTVLGEEITDAIVAQRAEAESQALRRAAWEERTEEIRRLIDEQSYPEAKKLGERLLGEEHLPEDLAAQTQALIDQAEAELKKVWENASWGEGTSEIQKKKKDNPPP